MRERIIGMCEELCNKKIALEEELIVSGQLDSFKIMELICSLEDEFHITFLPEEISELDNFSSAGHIAKIVESKLKSI